MCDSQPEGLVHGRSCYNNSHMFFNLCVVVENEFVLHKKSTQGNKESRIHSNTASKPVSCITNTKLCYQSSLEFTTWLNCARCIKE